MSVYVGFPLLFLACSQVSAHVTFPCESTLMTYCCTPRMKADCSSRCSTVKCPELSRRPPKRVAVKRPGAQTQNVDAVEYAHLGPTPSNNRRFNRFKQPTNCGKAPDWTPCKDIRQGNDEFQSCCQARRLGACAEFCRYDVKLIEIQRGVESGKCGQEDLNPYMDCASQGQDSTQCCEDSQLAATYGTPCLKYCDPSEQYGPVGLAQMVCAQGVETLLKCFLAVLPP